MAALTIDSLTPRQQERRRAVLKAALDLAASGGYDAVQMREVASDADVALGTLYHYFSSKDHVLAAGLVEWTERFGTAVAANPVTGHSAQDRVAALMTSATDAITSAPLVAKAMVTALNSPGGEVAACKEALSATMNNIISDALATAVDPAVHQRMARSIEHVWYSTLLAWVNGWMDADEVQEELIDAVRLIVPA